MLGDVHYPFAVGSIGVRFDRQHHLVMIVKASAELRRGAAASLSSHGVTLCGDLRWLAGGALRFPTDWAARKESADVTLIGHAFAPQRGASLSVASMQFGHPDNRFQRTIAVVGDRLWERKILGTNMGEPNGFKRVPLGYARAFGGPGFQANPIGIGFDEAGKPDRLPNLEEPGAVIKSPGDRPAPASFAPVPLEWQYPDAFLHGDAAARAPLLPVELATEPVQHAPAPQRLRFLRGDEPYRCEGMTANQELLEGALPGVRPRAFVLRSDGGSLDELRMRLDTVSFDIDEHEVHLVWRGAIAVANADASDVSAVFCTSEQVNATPMSIEGASQKFLT